MLILKLYSCNPDPEIQDFGIGNFKIRITLKNISFSGEGKSICYLMSNSKGICSNQFAVRRRKSAAISGFRCLLNLNSSVACWSTNGKLLSYCKKSDNLVNFQVETFDPAQSVPTLERKIQYPTTYNLTVKVPKNTINAVHFCQSFYKLDKMTESSKVLT